MWSNALPLQNALSEKFAFDPENRRMTPASGLIAIGRQLLSFWLSSGPARLSRHFRSTSVSGTSGLRHICDRGAVVSDYGGYFLILGHWYKALKQTACSSWLFDQPLPAFSVNDTGGDRRPDSGTST